MRKGVIVKTPRHSTIVKLSALAGRAAIVRGSAMVLTMKPQLAAFEEDSLHPGEGSA